MLNKNGNISYNNVRNVNNLPNGNNQIDLTNGYVNPNENNMRMYNNFNPNLQQYNQPFYPNLINNYEYDPNKL